MLKSDSFRLILVLALVTAGAVALFYTFHSLAAQPRSDTEQSGIVLPAPQSVADRLVEAAMSTPAVPSPTPAPAPTPGPAPHEPAPPVGPEYSAPVAPVPTPGGTIPVAPAPPIDLDDDDDDRHDDVDDDRDDVNDDGRDED